MEEKLPCVVIDGKTVDFSDVSSILSFVESEKDLPSVSFQYADKQPSPIGDVSSELPTEDIWQYTEDDLQNMKPKLIKQILRKAGLAETGAKERLIVTYLRYVYFNLTFYNNNYFRAKHGKSQSRGRPKKIPLPSPLMPSSSSQSSSLNSETWSFHEDCRLLSVIGDPSLLSGLSQLNDGIKSRAHLDAKTYLLSPFADKSKDQEAGIFNVAFNDRSHLYFVDRINKVLYPSLGAVVNELDMNRNFQHCDQATLEMHYRDLKRLYSISFAQWSGTGEHEEGQFKKFSKGI